MYMEIHAPTALWGSCAPDARHTGRNHIADLFTLSACRKTIKYIPSPPSPSLFLILHSQVLQKNMQLLMDSVDSLQQDTYRLLGYEKNLSKQAQQKQQFLQRRVSE